LEATQLIKQLADLLLEFAFLLARNIGSVAAAIQARNSDKPGSATKKRLSRLNTHVFKPTELVVAHDLQHCALGRGQMVCGPRPAGRSRKRRPFVGWHKS
jgi:hypothetical protein